jgi:hypothetical protein
MFLFMRFCFVTLTDFVDCIKVQAQIFPQLQVNPAATLSNNIKRGNNVFSLFPLSSFYEGKWSFVMFTTTTSTLCLSLLLICLSLTHKHTRFLSLVQGSQTRGPPDAIVRPANISETDKIKNFDQI